MFRFYVVSDKMIDKQNPIKKDKSKWVDKNYIYFYMIAEVNWEKKSVKKFKEINSLMEDSFITLNRVEHDYWSWYWVKKTEIKKSLWIKVWDIKWSFDVEWNKLLKFK